MSKAKRVTLLLGLAVTVGLAAAIELIINGGFETGTFAGWSVSDQAGGSGSWFVTGAATTPLSGFPTVGPASGSFYAVTDQTGPGAHVLEQSFTVPIGATSVVVSFDMFTNNQNGTAFVDPSGLDFTSGGTSAPNQHDRVDILTFTAGAFSTAPADIVDNLIAPAGDPAGPNPYTHYIFDISGLVTPGTTYVLRFGEVDNQFFFNQGVDNVSIVANGAPEPATLALASLALAGLAFARRRQRA
jgi:hypothetical protein